MYQLLRTAFGGKPAARGPVTWVQDVAEGRTMLIDVRNHNEVQQTGKARGAVHIPLGSLPALADPEHPDCPDGLTVDTQIAVYCASGMRSGMAAQQLMALGYTRVENIGGLNDWLLAGGDIER